MVEGLNKLYLRENIITFNKIVRFVWLYGKFPQIEDILPHGQASPPTKNQAEKELKIQEYSYLYKEIIKAATLKGVLKCIRGGARLDSSVLNIIGEEELQNSAYKILLDSINRKLYIPAALLDIISKRKLAALKNDAQDKIYVFLLTHLRETIYIPEHYLILANEATFEKIRKHQEEIHKNIISHIGFSLDISTYVKLANDDTLQDALYIGIKNKLRNNCIPVQYLNLASAATLEKIKRELQHDIYNSLIKLLLKDEKLHSEIMSIIDNDTLQQALRSAFVERIYKMESTLFWPEQRNFPHGFTYINKQHINLAEPDTINYVRKQCWHELNNIIYNCVIDAVYLDDGLILLAGDDITQKSLLKGIIYSYQNDYGVLKDHLELASSKTLAQAALSLGYSIRSFRLLRPIDEIVASTREIATNKEELSQVTIKLISNFFKSTQTNDDIVIEPYINEIVSHKSEKELKKIVFDRAFLPVGIKIHIEGDVPNTLQVILQRSIGFRMVDDCFVSNPMPNVHSVKAAIESLHKYLTDVGAPLSSDSVFYQACMPYRIKHKLHQAVATVAFLFAKDYNFKIDDNLEFEGSLSTNQTDGIGLLIYDAGGVVVGKHDILTKDGFKPLRIKGRTDMLLCDTVNDIELANFLLTVMSHAENEHFAFHEIAQDFIREFKLVLRSHGIDDLLNLKYYMYAKYENADRFISMMKSIADIRRQEELQIKEYNSYVDRWELLQHKLGVKTSPRPELLKTQKEIHGFVTVQIRKLIEKYKKRIYNGKEFISPFYLDK